MSVGPAPCAEKDVMTRFGGWKVRSVLAERRYSVLYLAEDASGRPSVVKQDRSAPDDQIGHLRFAREKRLSGMIHHPAFPALLDSGSDWIAFERLGPDLKASATLEEAQAARLLGQIGASLAYLHARGIVHRDLKPEHILFRSDRSPVLIDLGAAGLLGDDPTAALEAVGSPTWVAPEQARGARPAPSADIWSLARIGVWLRDRNVDRPPWSGLIAELIRRGLSLDPAERPSAVDFYRALS